MNAYIYSIKTLLAMAYVPWNPRWVYVELQLTEQVRNAQEVLYSTS